MEKHNATDLPPEHGAQYVGKQAADVGKQEKGGRPMVSLDYKEVGEDGM